MICFSKPKCQMQYGIFLRDSYANIGRHNIEEWLTISPTTMPRKHRNKKMSEADKRRMRAQNKAKRVSFISTISTVQNELLVKKFIIAFTLAIKDGVFTSTGHEVVPVIPGLDILTRQFYKLNNKAIWCQAYKSRHMAYTLSQKLSHCSDLHPSPELVKDGPLIIYNEFQ